MLKLNPTLPVSAAQNQLTPERVPSLEERTEAMTACLGAVLPQGIISLIAKCAMERFDGEMFGPQQWIDCWGAIPVAMTKTLVELRDLVKQKAISGAETEKPVEQMNEVECANFLRTQGIEVCKDEHFEPTEELYECLNRRVRPQDKLLAGFTCAVTYIPQFVLKDVTILAVTARTLALDLAPNPVQGEVANLAASGFVFDTTLTPEDANRTEASCFFVMEQDVAPNTQGNPPSDLIAAITSQGDKGWQLPEPRNFFAAVFARRAWKGQFLYGTHPFTYTYGQGKSRGGHFFSFGGFGLNGLYVEAIYIDSRSEVGAGGSRKFKPFTLR